MKFGKIINFLEENKFNLKTWLIAFLALISTRLLIESLLLGFPARSFEGFVSLFVHTFSFFVLTYLIFVIFLVFLIKKNVQKIASFLLWGFGIIIFPPIIDKLIFQGGVYKSFYIFDSFQGLILRFFTFFGENPDWGITWGTRVNILITLIAIGVYVYFKTKSKKKVFVSLIGGYCLFFVLSCFPSLVVFLIKPVNLFDVSYSTVAGYFMSPLAVFGLKSVVIESFLAKKLALIYLPLILFLLIGFSFKLNFKKTINLMKNLRYPQLIFNLGLLFIGLGLGCLYNPEFFQLDFFSGLVVLNLILIITTTWFFSVLVNDLVDFKIDKISNKERPLINKTMLRQDFKDCLLILFCFSVLSSILISPVILLVIMSYFLLTWLYSCYPFRLKCFPGIAGFLIALASLNFLLIGFMVFSENQSLIIFPWRIYWFLFLAYFFITPLKDLKDLEGDKKNKVYTLVFLLGREKTRLTIASFLFSFYLLSVYVLNKQELFLIAFVFGIINFLIINNPKINERKLNSWVLSLVFIYGLLVIKTIFL